MLLGAAAAPVDDPSRDGWDTEAFNRRAGKQLKQLQHWIEDGLPDASGAVDLIDPAYRGAAMTPTSLDESFVDGPLRVERGRMNGQPTSFTGAAGLLQSLKMWLDPIDHRHAKFKLYRVERTDDGAITEQFVALTGDGEAGHVERNATWRIAWTDPGSDALPRIRSIDVLDFEQVTLAGDAPALFSDCTAAAMPDEPNLRDQLTHGIGHWWARLGPNMGIDTEGRYGMAVGDVNGDGLDDLYLCDAGGLPNRLLLHRPDGTLQDISAAAGVDWLEPTTAALLVDLDNDGDQDLVVAAHPALLVMANDGTGKFNLRATIRDVLFPFTLTAADYDKDGDVDVYACAHAPSGRSVGYVGAPIPYHDANNGGRNVLLRNEGDMKFTDVTRAVGLDENNTRFSYAAAWEDYDNDGDADVYVANDYGRNNLYRNDDGRFTDVAAAAGVEDISAGMSVTWGDYNTDGHMDLYISNMYSSAGNRVTYQRRFKTATDETVRAQYQRHARGNTLFENAGDGTFRDVSETANVTMGRWAWSNNFVDVNNDGREDLIVANGYITNDLPDDL